MGELERIRLLIRQADLELALDQALDIVGDSTPRYRNELILHKASLRQLQTNARKGLITARTQSIERTRLTNSLLDLLDEWEHSSVHDAAHTTGQQKSDAVSSSLVESVDVLLVVATKVEILAVLSAVERQSGKTPSETILGDKTYWYLGQLGGAQIGLVWSEMGSGGPGGSSLTILEAARTLNPRSVISVGIAFGARPGKQQVGDILVSERVMNYAQQRIGTSDKGDFDPIPRGDRATASVRLLDRFRHADLSWQGAPVRFGLLLSGPVLVDNLAYRKSLQQLEPEAIGGEMEGVGLYDVAQRLKLDWIIVKAICDWADGHKGDNKDEFQATAARNAAEFTIHTLALGGFQ